jgi:hypothetical protein
MPIRTKYRDSINLMKELEVKNLKVWEEDGFLQIRGIVKNTHDKIMIVNKIEEENEDNALDINVQLEVEEE